MKNKARALTPALLRKIRKAAEEGRIEFAPPPSPELVPPVEFCAHFFRAVLNLNWASVFASGESDLTDFTSATRDELVSALARE